MKLGSAPSTKSFLIWNENSAIFSTKSFLLGFSFRGLKLHYCLEVEHLWMDVNADRHEKSKNSLDFKVS